MKKDAKIYIAGHRGLVGSALVRNLKAKGYNNLILKTRKELDLLNQKAVADFFQKEKPDYVFLAAAKVGGIMANKNYPADFIYENLVIETNIINSAYKNKVEKLIFLGSSCIYPKLSPQPIKEEYLLTSPLETSNEAYAIAKIAGLKLCAHYNTQYKTNFIAAMPTNLYGPEDNFDLENSHVLPAMMRKFHEAKINKIKEVILWGSGKPKREFLFIDDLAEALILVAKKAKAENGLINIGVGEDLSIKELAEEIKEAVSFKGKIVWDKTKPDGTPRKLLNISKLKSLGFKPKTSLAKGIKLTYKWFLENEGRLRK